MTDTPDIDVSSLRIDRTRGRRKRRGRWVSRVVWLALIAGAVWLFQRPVRGWVDRLRLQEVQVAAVVRRNLAASGVSGTAANGYVVARTQAALSADAPGRLVAMNVVEGSFVEAGDVVARLYFDELAAALQRAEADLRRAEAAVGRAVAETRAARDAVAQREADAEAAREVLVEARAEELLAETDEQRAARLVEEGVENEQALDRARRDGAAARARVAAAVARVTSAEAAIVEARSAADAREAAEVEARAGIDVARAGRDQAAAVLEKTYVRAPFDGVVVRKEAEVGEVVSPNSQGGSTARGSVATMVDLASLEVQAEVPETSLSSVRVGGPARIFLDAFPDEPYPARIDRIWPIADRQKGTVEVRVAFERRDERLRPEMGVRVVFLDAEAAPEESVGGDVLMVPRDSVVTVDGQSSVFVLERDRVRLQPVRVGDAQGTRVVVETGLEGDERVVLAPPPDLSDGERVRTQTP